MLYWHVTGLWYPEATSLPYYGRISDPGNGQVVQVRNGSRSAQVDVSMFDPIVQHLAGKPYARMLRCYDDDELIFWGPAKLLTGKMGPGTLTIAAMDPTIRLIRHQLRRGDLADAPVPLSEGNDDKGQVTVDYNGLRMLMDAGLNTTEQTDRGVPNLGIDYGDQTATAAPDSRMQFDRGTPVFDAMQQLSSSVSADASGPDFDIRPLDDYDGQYAVLDTFDRQGEDLSHSIQFHYGTGLQNLEDLEYTDGSQYTSHVHVLSRDLSHRITAANVESSAETGPYVDWDTTDFDTSNIDDTAAEETLRAFGEEYLQAYSRPLFTVDLTLPLQSRASLRVGVDYHMGDTVSVAGRRGFQELDEAPYRINAITRAQAGGDNDVRVTVGVVADRVAEYGDSVGDED